MTNENQYEATSSYFKEKKYVIADSVLPEEQCKELTNYLLHLSETKQTKKDGQCPISESVYGDSVLDTLLEDMRPTIEKITGLSLHPTYSYARKYLPGDQLEPHLDRAACEISATLTLGFDGEVWPIHVSTDDNIENDIGAIEVPVGSMIIYRGMEINHWREPYTQGKWQCQVFLHYVDANGPHKDEKYDGRAKLGDHYVKSKFEKTENEYLYFGFLQSQKYLFTTKHNVLSPPLIDSIVSYAQGKLFDAKVGNSPTNEMLDKSVRNVSHCWLPFENFDWLYRLLEAEIRDMNWINFKYVLDKMEAIDYLEYHAGTEEDSEHGHGKYVAHVDGSINGTRKLSFSILLSDPSEFEGGDLLIYDSHKPYVAEKKKGTITFFPSTVLHEVTPVTRGVRRSLVSWIHGPQFA